MTGFGMMMAGMFLIGPVLAVVIARRFSRRHEPSRQ